MAEVVALNGEPIEPETEHDIALVEILEHAIKEIKRGKINSIALVLARYDDEDTGHKDYMQVDTSWHGKRLLLLAGAARLLHRLNIDQDEENAA